MENPSIMSHISVGTNDFSKAIEFYDQVLATIGAKRTLDLTQFKAMAYGKQYPEFWVQAPFDGKPASVGNGTHFAFFATSTDQVDAFYAKAIELGAVCDGKPGPREHYGPGYYGCFVRDLDNNKIEATFIDESKGHG